MRESSQRIGVMVAVAIALSGCGSAEIAKPDMLDQFVQQQTAFVVDEVGDAEKYPGALAPFATEVVHVRGPGDPKLDQLVNARWNGTVEDLTKHVARHLGYHTAAQGEKLPMPLYVSIQADHLTAVGMLRQGFAQARGRAQLEVDTASRVMRVVYNRPERSPIPHQDDLQL